MKSWIPIIIFIIAGSLLAFRTHQPSVPVTYKDTPKVIFLIFNARVWDSKIDSLHRYVSPAIGSSLSKDDFINTIGLYNGLLGRLFASAVWDSVKVGKPVLLKQ